MVHILLPDKSEREAAASQESSTSHEHGNMHTREKGLLICNQRAKERRSQHLAYLATGIQYA